ncbi:hypothetical protein [Clostridium sp. DL1XJH146]
MDIGELIGTGLFYLILILIVLGMFYLIIKLEVKYAIVECLPKIKLSVKDIISQNNISYGMDKKNK